jgi:hypothetical protein
MEMKYTPPASREADIEQWMALMEPSSVAVNMSPEPMNVMPLSGLPPKVIQNNKYNEMNAKYRAGCHKIIEYFESCFFLVVAYSWMDYG